MTPKRDYITSIRFRHYKAFKDFSLSLRKFNVLVGPNNSGKSTILGALRILSEGLRRANARKPELIDGPNGIGRGYPVSLAKLPVSTENVFYNYDDSEAAIVTFQVSNGNELILYFPAKGVCLLLTHAKKAIRTPSDFKREFKLKVSFVPVLGPVEHEEDYVQEETARLALLSYSASRNFRNIWYHFPKGFDEFRETIRTSWPGMDIKKPELISRDGKNYLYMFCPENRYDREIFWAGFGFQVWCQMLTFILQGRDASLLIILKNAVEECG